MDLAPRRRTTVAALLVLGCAVAGLIAVVDLLVPPGLPIPPPPATSPAAATCEEPARQRTPVPVTSGALFGCPRTFDGRLVVIEGEAIGEVLDGPGDRSWVQVNDDAYAQAGPLQTHGRHLGTNSGVAVLLPVGQQPDVLGGPSTWGDRLRVIGEYQAASAADQGGPAVIAEAVIPLARGERTAGVPATALRWTALVAVAVTALVGGAVWRRRAARASG